MLVSFNWLKEYLGETDLTAESAAELLGAHAFEIEDIEEKGNDTVIDVDVLPNRSSDCLSHRGIARELASIMGTSLAHDPLETEPELSSTDVISVDIKDSEACPRFTASLITGVEIKDSPQWLTDRLEAIGQRSINNIVDATNYVMFAIGQPLHAYDADLFPQVDGQWQFVVRPAKEGEMVSLLAEGGKNQENSEDRDVELKGGETLVVDGSNDTPIGLAGVKGGRFAGIHGGTTKVIIEAANWHPIKTRQTARPLGIVTDAGKRFENEVTRELAMYAQAEIVKLITGIAGGVHEGTIDVYLEKVESHKMEVSIAKTNALLGLDLDVEAMEQILRQVGCEVENSGETLIAQGPWERTDLNIAEDYIEEIGRIYGYDHVESVVPEAVPLTEMNIRHYYSEQLREILLEAGFSEVITSSFRKKDKIQLRNALASDKSFLRSSLIKNLTEVLDKNASHNDLLGVSDTRVFEIGTVFSKSEATVTEHFSLALGLRLKPSGYSGKEDKILNQVMEQIADSLGSKLDWTVDKGVAEINLTALIPSLPVPTVYRETLVAPEIAYQAFSVYPAMSRDIAMWTKEGTTAEEVVTVLDTAAGDLCVRTTHVDEFTKDGRTSLAFRLVFQANDRTLTDEELNPIMEAVYKVATEQGWETR